MMAQQKTRYIKLKTDMQPYFAENVNGNLPHLRVKASGYMAGPSQYMNIGWYEICQNMEGKGLLGPWKLDVLLEIIEGMPIGEDDLRNLIHSAKKDIMNMTGGTAPPPSVPNAKAGTATGVRDPGKGFHQEDDHVVSYDDMEPIFQMELKKSVGFITVGDSSGTGFRVGDQYIMTAYHVFKHKFDDMKQLLVEMVDQSSVNNTDTLSKLSKIFSIDEVLDAQTCVERCLAPTNKELPFGTLAQHLGQSLMEKTEGRWNSGTRIAFNCGTDNERKFELDLDVPFADKDNDILILKLRIDDRNLTAIPDPLHLEPFSVNNKMHLIGYLKSSKAIKSLKIDTNCQVYTDAGKLGEDVTNAQKWWKTNLPNASLDECKYSPGKNETRNGRTILHASKEFEHRSSGCPAVVIDDYTTKRLVVQLMYLSGYPTLYYETQMAQPPPPKVCFESGISMKNIAKILLKAKQEALKNAIFPSN